jgi:hypothetical protein
MPSLLIALGILLLSGAGLALYVRKGGTKEVKDEVDPEAPRNVERGTAASEAAARAPAHSPLSEADAVAVAELHEYYQEIGTTEIPVVQRVRRRHGYRKQSRKQRQALRRRALDGFATDPLAAAIPGRHRVEEPVMFAASVERWFAPQLYISASAFPEPPAEPEALPPLDFTGEWAAGTFDVRPVGARR